MLWSLVLPFEITIGLSIGVIGLAFYTARRYGKRLVVSMMAGLLVAAIAFIPLFILANYVTSPFRFGRFRAADVESVRFAQVQDYLPPNASDIDMITTTHHHHVRFRISEKQLITWMESLWDVAGQRSPMTRSEAAFGVVSKGGDDPEFVKLGMSPNSDFLLFEGPFQQDWGGPTLWYDSKAETAWQYVGYW
jgi:hypothetical protein